MRMGAYAHETHTRTCTKLNDAAMNQDKICPSEPPPLKHMEYAGIAKVISKNVMNI